MGHRAAHTFMRDALIASLVVGASAIGAQPSISQAQNARAVARIALPAVVLIVVQDANMQPLAQGSGFVVANGLIATSLHVIEGAHFGSDSLRLMKSLKGHVDFRVLDFETVP